MTKNLLIEVIKKLQKACQKSRVKIAFTGGIAVGVYGVPRTTYDVDGFILASIDQIDLLLSALVKEGFKYEKEHFIKVIKDKKFLTLVYSKYKMYIDLFVAIDDFEKGILRRSRKLKFNRIAINVIAPEDLILLKLQAGRERDLEDIRGIILENISRLDFKYLKKWAKKLDVYHFLRDELESLRMIK